MSDDIRFIDTRADLDIFCSEIRGAPWVALDTEFIREKTYYPQLCLIQLATDRFIACIDPLTLPDLSPLHEVLNDPEVVKVVHAAHQDLEILLQETGRVPAPVFDTQVAASLLGHGDQIGYAKLVQTVLGVTLEKGLARTDWALRPLEPEQLSYAADDVRYLAQAYPLIMKALQEKGRLAWLEDDFRALADPGRYQPDPDGAWRRIKGVQQLKPRQLAVLQQLAAWREREAMARNKPRRWILQDEILTELARRQPADLRALGKVRGLEERAVTRHGNELLALIREAAALPPERWPSIPERRAVSPEQDELVDVAMGILRHRARMNDISPAAIASRREVEALVCGDDEIQLIHGWRARLAGETIRKWLRGQLHLRVRDGELVLE